jgi:AcrR family transcriptional regulator
MMASRKALAAREKLLAAACDVFVEKGFSNATVAEICTRANANVAAVSYYFGSKKALYQEAWRHSFAQSITAHPQDGGVPAHAPAEERLQGQLRALMERISDENSRDFFISQMEFMNPTGLLEEVMHAELIPLREQTLAVVRELLGPQASEQQVVFCETCIISMCIHPMLMRRMRQKAASAETPAPIQDLAAFADHVVAFALAGINALRAHPQSAGQVSA